MLLGMARLDYRVDSRLPITPDILDKLLRVLPSVCNSEYESMLFSALFTTAYFGFFRIGELVVNKSLAHSHTLGINDISFSNNGMSMFIQLRFSKTDQLGRGSMLGLESITSHLCPVQLMKKYLHIRPQRLGPAFIHFNGLPVTRYQFNAVLKKSLEVSNVSSANYCSHSFRIGAASHSSKIGFTDDEIKEFGRWDSKVSKAYKSYIRIPTLQLSNNVS